MQLFLFSQLFRLPRLLLASLFSPTYNFRVTAGIVLESDDGVWAFHERGYSSWVVDKFL
jgi:hypothetical protein